MNAIDSKDELFGLIHNSTGTVEDKCKRWHIVLNSLVFTRGLWKELDYCYKGVELAEAIRGLSALEQEHQENICQHWKIHHKNAELLTEVGNRAYQVSMMFHDLKNE